MEAVGHCRFGQPVYKETQVIRPVRLRVRWIGLSPLRLVSVAVRWLLGYTYTYNIYIYMHISIYVELAKQSASGLVSCLNR